MEETNDASEEKRFISMLSDYGFKITFGNESHPKFLRRALQALIDSDIPILAVKLLRNEVSAVTKTSRGGLFDMICEDEKGQIFIVEMQLLNLANMIHRAKFYAYHRYNTMVKKGHYRFDDLKKIYTVSILAGGTYQTELYHQIGTIKNQNGELIDDQITHVIIELDKFQKTLAQINTDLDKLLYTMKLTDTAPQDVQLPDFMREDWLEETLAELERSNLTPEQRADWEMIIAGNMSEKVAREQEIEQAVEQKVEKAVEKAKKETEAIIRKEKEETIVKMIQKGYAPDDIAEIAGVSSDEVLSIKKKMNIQ